MMKQIRAVPEEPAADKRALVHNLAVPKTPQNKGSRTFVRHSMSSKAIANILDMRNSTKQP